MTYRVVQWSTGNVGALALRTIINHPELELAGVWVHSDAKVGKDAGELCGRDPVGVRATNSIDEILALKADAVVYTSNGDIRPGEAIDDMTALLTAGTNVISTAIVPLVHPESYIPELRDRLAAACTEGGASFFNSGIDPGFANDILPLFVSGLCESWDEVRVQEVVNYATYDRPEILFDVMGFGEPMDHVPMLLTPGVLAFAWGGTVRLLAEGLGVEVEEIRQTYEKCPAEKAIQIGDHTVEPGTMAGLRFEVQGIVNGKPAIVVEHVTRLDDDLAPEWATGNSSYRVLISGNPPMNVSFEVTDENGDHCIGGVVVTATRVVNCVPAVCEAPPGLLSALDLPLITGRGLGPR